MSLSVVISTYNRKEKLRLCLESVKDIADEIIVVDNTSSDDSVALAKKYTKHVFVRPNNPMLNVNKNFGFSKASKEWILYLDDDEKLTPELQEEIKKWKAGFSQSLPSSQPSPARGEGDQGIQGYYMPRKNIIFGKWIEHTGWYPDHQLRLFKREKGKFAEVHVHEMLSIEGEIGYLKEPLEHSNYETIHEFFYKMIMTYAPNEADVYVKNGYVFHYLDAIRFPVKEFLGRFFARQGYKDGLHGLMLSLLMACYHLAVFGYLWEKQHFIPVTSEVLMPELSKEIKNMKKEMRYWSRTQNIESEKNSVKKIFYKTARKIGL